MSEDALNQALSATNPTPPKRARGGQPGNSNRIKHGNRSKMLRVGALPVGHTHTRKQLGRLRSLIEQALLAKAGEIGVTAAATVSTVLVHEARRCVLTRIQREKWATLNLQEQLALTQAIGKASDQRDAALRLLELDRDSSQDMWATFDAQQRASLPACGPATAATAIEATTRDDALGATLDASTEVDA